MSIESRFNAAVAACAEQGVPFRYNDASICCRSCYVMDNPAEVFALAQFGDLAFRDDAAVYVSEDEVPCTCEDDEYDDADELVREGERCGVCTGYADARVTHYDPVRTLYVYFSVLRSAQVFNRVFEAEGFTVKWDGTRHTALAVVF